MARLPTAALTISFVLAGCATQTWHHATKGQQDFYRDNSACMAMAGTGQPQQIIPNPSPFLQGYNQGAAMAAAQNQQTIYQQCMYGNGWYLAR